jgi:hypothetical protein
VTYESKLRISLRGFIYHTQYKKNDRGDPACLSNIAHIQRLRWHGPAALSIKNQCLPRSALMLFCCRSAQSNA